MEVVMLLSMLLFIGIGTVHVVLGISEAYGKREVKKSVAATQTRRHNRSSRA